MGGVTSVLSASGDYENMVEDCDNPPVVKKTILSRLRDPRSPSSGIIRSPIIVEKGGESTPVCKKVMEKEGESTPVSTKVVEGARSVGAPRRIEIETDTDDSFNQSDISISSQLTAASPYSDDSAHSLDLIILSDKVSEISIQSEAAVDKVAYQVENELDVASPKVKISTAQDQKGPRTPLGPIDRNTLGVVAEKTWKGPSDARAKLNIENTPPSRLPPFGSVYSAPTFKRAVAPSFR